MHQVYSLVVAVISFVSRLLFISAANYALVSLLEQNLLRMTIIAMVLE